MTASPLPFLGSWRLDRVIEDRLGGGTTHVVGSTELTLERDGRIRWSEHGTLRWAELELPVSRVLYIENRTGTWVVTFADGRAFHPWTVGAPVIHLCGPDRYVGQIDVLHDPIDSWTVSWRVSGPSKDHTISTNLQSAGSSLPGGRHRQ